MNPSIKKKGRGFTICQTQLKKETKQNPPTNHQTPTSNHEQKGTQKEARRNPKGQVVALFLCSCSLVPCFIIAALLQIIWPPCPMLL
jgi:hypothetical protein